MDLVMAIYGLTKKFPKEETYGLSSQMRRSAVSIISNIAEGTRRISPSDVRRFLLISFGSGAELETQVEVAKRLRLVENFDYTKIENLLNEIMRMLNKLKG